MGKLKKKLFQLHCKTDNYKKRKHENKVKRKLVRHAQIGILHHSPK